MIVVSGARGFVGREVCEVLSARGHRVLRIGRGADADLQWPADGAPFGAEALAAISGARGVVHLAGENIGARWTARRRLAVRASRVTLTGVLARAVAAAPVPPAAFVSASAVGLYGDRGDEWLTETSGAGSGFLATLARDWEQAAAPASEAGVRVVHMRMGVVFGPGGGMITKLKLPFQMGGGARLGSGRQWMSWISLADLVRFVLRALDDPALNGAVNLTTPNPITNGEFTTTFARLLKRPAFLTAPAAALRLAFGDMADGVLLASQRVRPARLAEMGFSYSHPDAEAALRYALGS